MVRAHGSYHNSTCYYIFCAETEKEIAVLIFFQKKKEPASQLTLSKFY